jgi:hypothetical protein
MRRMRRKRKSCGAFGQYVGRWKRWALGGGWIGCVREVLTLTRLEPLQYAHLADLATPVCVVA